MNSVFTGIIHLTFTGLWADLKTRTNQNTQTLVHPKDHGFITLFPITGLSAPIYHFTGVGRDGQIKRAFDPFTTSVFPFGSRRPRFRGMSLQVSPFTVSL